VLMKSPTKDSVVERVRRIGPLHDEISRKRQSASASALLLIVPAASTLFYATSRLVRWPRLEVSNLGTANTSGTHRMDLTDHSALIAVALVVLGWMLLVVASGALINAGPRLRNTWRTMLHSIDTPQQNLRSLPDEGESHQCIYRHIYYYLGVTSLLLAVSALVVGTGGLSSSPFAPVLLTFLASAQALGRYRTNCRVFSIMGFLILATVGSLQAAGLTRLSAQPAPALLTLILTLIGFLVGAIITYNSKLENPRSATSLSNGPISTSAADEPSFRRTSNDSTTVGQLAAIQPARQD
jgi:hypothetical protein